MAASPGEEIQLILPSNQRKPGMFSEFGLERSSRRWLMRPSLASLQAQRSVGPAMKTLTSPSFRRRWSMPLSWRTAFASEGGTAGPALRLRKRRKLRDKFTLSRRARRHLLLYTLKLAPSRAGP